MLELECETAATTNFHSGSTVMRDPDYPACTVSRKGLARIKLAAASLIVQKRTKYVMVPHSSFYYPKTRNDNGLSLSLASSFEKVGKDKKRSESVAEEN